MPKRYPEEFRRKVLDLVAEVSESVADTQNLLDQQVDCFGGPIDDRPGAEVGQELRTPGAQGAGQSAHLGHT